MDEKLEIIIPISCLILALIVVWLPATLPMLAARDKTGITTVSILATIVILGKRKTATYIWP